MTRQELLTIYKAFSSMETAFVLFAPKEAQKNFSEMGYWEDIGDAQDILSRELSKEDK